MSEGVEKETNIDQEQGPPSNVTNVDTHPKKSTQEANNNKQKTKCGDPAIAGFGAFALSTFLLSLNLVGWMDTIGPAIWLGIPFGGLTQLTAGILCFLVGNTFGLLVFSTYGSFWLCYALIYVTRELAYATWDAALDPPYNFTPDQNYHGLSFGAKTPADYDYTMAFFLLVYLLFTVLVLIAAAFVNMTAFVTFLFLCISLMFSVIAYFMPDVDGWVWETLQQIAGYLLMLAALGAWYSMLNLLYKTTCKCHCLPLGPAPARIFASLRRRN